VVHAEWNNLVGYCQSHSYVGAAILSALDLQEKNEGEETALTEDEEMAQALFVFRTLVDLYLPLDFYASKLEGLIAEIESFNAILATHLPRLVQHMSNLLTEGGDPVDPTDTSQIPTNPYIVKWYSTLFVNCFPLETTLQIWDALLCDGIEILHRVALVVLRHSNGLSMLIPLSFPSPWLS